MFTLHGGPPLALCMMFALYAAALCSRDLDKTSDASSMGALGVDICGVIHAFSSFICDSPRGLHDDANFVQNKQKN